MNKTIILAGNGQLPCHVVEELKIRNLDFVIIGFENNEISLKLKKYKYQIINFGKIITKLKHLKKKGYENIIMVGGLKRPKVFEIKPDFNSLKILPLFAKKIIEGGDNNLLSFAINKMLEMGFNILDIKKLLPDCFLGKGVFTKTSPSKNMIKDINKGQMILNQISKFDIGQSIIIQQGTVVGIEGVQGTDVLIQQSKKYLLNGNDSILIKLIKQKQDLRVDLPTIGINTIKKCKQSNISGIAFSAKKTIFLNTKKIINFCDRNNFFLIGV